MKYWLNGRLVSADSARLDPSDRGFTLGDGLFETICYTDGRARHLARHLARLRRAAEYLAIPLDWDDQAIEAGLEAVVAAAHLPTAAIRITLSRGPAPRGLLPPAVATPTLVITAGPLAPAAPPARAIIATVTRRNQASPLARMKTLNGLDNILARREALERGADDAILLKVRGDVAEASVANLFILADGVLKTPPIEDGALPGIARGVLIERCGAIEATLRPADLLNAGAVFLSNSLGLRMVASIDGAMIGDGNLPAELAESVRIALSSE
ncbi:MAG: aminotransferase class IV [Aliidongia sp.]